MKYINYTKLAWIIALCFFAGKSTAQLVNCNAFLQGNYIEVGINITGAYGTSEAAPSGYHPRSGTSTSLQNTCTSSCPTAADQLGFVADPDKDGWTVGSPAYYGDYFLPGEPQEGWSIKSQRHQSDAYNVFSECSATDLYTGSLSGSNISYSSVGSIRSSTWQGINSDDIAITQVTYLDTANLYFTVRVTLKNTGSTTVDSIYYLRTVDPDNDETLSGGSFSTINTIVYQLPNTLNATLVSAQGTVYSEAWLGLGTLDCRAKCFIISNGSTLYPTDGNDTLYNQLSTNETYSGTITADDGIGLVFNIGSIDPGDSATFTYAYILKQSDLLAALRSTSSLWNATGDTASVEATGDTASVCQSTLTTVNVTNPGNFTWVWYSLTGEPLSTYTGTTTQVTTSTTVISLMAVGIAGTCAGTPNDTLYINLNPATAPPATPIAASNSPICAGNALDLTSSSSTSGVVYDWAGPSSFTSTIQNPVISGATTAASGVYSVTAVIAGCYSGTATTSVTVNATPGAITGATTVCAGSSGLLGDSPGGGTWSSSNSSVATVVSGTGSLTGVATGTATISYLLGGGCLATTIVTVDPVPALISGALAICNGTSTMLSSSPAGGAWNSSNTTVATIVSGTGLVSGLSVGTSIITYTLAATGCYRTTTETITPVPGAITGTPSVCVGSQTALGDAPGGGDWSSSNILVATVGSGSGAVSGVSSGTATITYALGTGCKITTQVTVNPVPAAITGANNICLGSSAFLTDATGGGAWSSSNTTVATVAGSTVTGAGAGTATISYTVATGCYSTISFTVNPVPTAITGAKSVCMGSATVLGSSPSGGTWSSGNSAVATVVAGAVTGVSQGTAAITYSIGTGCIATTIVTVYPLPAAITGTTTLCSGGTTTLGDVTGGGAWSSGNTAVATIGTGSGNVTAVSAGTAIITYAITATGCAQTITFTVSSSPSAITGAATVCAGFTTNLGDLPSGGIWSSSNGAVATVSGPGIVSGVSAGTATITYTLGISCIATTTITVNPVPNPITPSGGVSICPGSTVPLADGTPGGTWSSSNTSVATVGASSGTVTGVNSGTVTISYTNASGCAALKTVTVSIAPGAISPSLPTVCVGSVADLTDGISGGLWTSAGIAIATVGSLTGIVNGVSAGTTSITYAIGSCYTTTTVTVTGLLSAGAITGPSVMCATTPVTLTDAATGGVWSSGNTAVATVGGTGTVSGVSSGTVIISYSVTNSCGTAVAIHTLTVSTLSAGTITGPSLLCSGTFTTYTDAAPGGVWSLGNASATIAGTGFLTAITPGTNIITYSVTNTCGTSVTTKSITIGAYLTAGSITGPSMVCAGSSITLTDPAPGGIWSAGNTDATVTGGVVTGVSGGTDAISYTVSSSCGSASAVQTVTVIPIPAAGAITGPSTICLGAPVTYTDAATGGVWSMSNTAAIVSGAGIVTPLSTGLDIISYTVSNACGTAFTTETINISPALTAGSISGAGSVCVGATITLADGAAGGVWSASNTNATVSGGVVTGVAAGTLVISYTVTNACGSVSATYPITVNALAVAGSILGPSALCLGSGGAYTDAATGGVWTVANATAAISGAGVVTPVSAGTNTVSYSVTNVCGAVVATEDITIGTAPSAGIISGPASVCTGTPAILTDGVSGGAWSASNTDASISSGGVVTGLSAGLDTISYTVATTCGTAVATQLITVNLSADPGVIDGPSALCASTFALFTDAVAGGTWSASNASATITGSGVLSALIPSSTDTIIYTVSNACGAATATKAVSIGVELTAGAISGAAGVCQGASITITDGASGGVWSSSNTSVATVGAGTGTVTGVSAGTAVISYSVTLFCGTAVATATVTVSPPLYAGAILGASSVCVSSSITLVNPVSGGVWSSSNGDAVVAGGTVTGVIPGTDTISYTITNFCGTASVTKTITINPLVATGSISGPASVCAGAAITLTDPATGGLWSSSNITAATVGTSSGIVTGISGGTAVISYVISGSCGSTLSTATVTVNALPLPGSISGPPGVCVGSLITLSNPASGGEWSSSNGNATITTGGLVTGITAGTDVINYTVTSVCGIAAAADTITISVFPVAGTISGPPGVCAGASVPLTDASGGGIWSSGNPAIATVGTLTGIVTGIASGTDNITYTVTNACGSVNTTAAITVNPLPVVAAITGGDSVCEASDITLADATAGGAWGAYNANATVSVSGFVNGIVPGTDTIEYSVTNSCGTASAIQTITILPIPGPGTITGGSDVCIGSSATLADASAGGTWSASNADVTITGPGVIEGVTAGTVTIYYTVTNMCGANTDSKIITVNPAPLISPITGLANECAGLATTLDDATAGGVWSSSNTAVATIGAFTGIITGVSPGTATVAYSFTDTYGCTASVTVTDRVSLMPVIAAITGPADICAGAATTLADAAGGGAWTSANAAIATINAVTGTINGLAAGTDKIYYTVSNGCGSVTDSTIIVISAAPSAGSISAAYTNVCSGAAIDLTDAIAGGYWGSSNPSVAAVGSAGVVSGVSSGSAIITYTVTGPGGCSAIASIDITVGGTAPAASVTPTGSLTLCHGSSITMVVASSGAGLTYQWMRGGSDIAGADLASYTTTTAGIYSVQVGNGSCSAVIDGPAISAPPTPVITYSAPDELLTGISYSTYQWYLNSVAIPGANTYLIHYTAGGAYSVDVTDANGCADTSLPYAVAGVSSVNKVTGNDDVKVYPNPASSVVHVQAPVAVSVRVLAIDGKILVEITNAKDIDISNLSVGMYLVEVYDESGILIKTAKFAKVE